jgi:aminoglycoside phosphotransferase (APT) family kinase protein
MTTITPPDATCPNAAGPASIHSRTVPDIDQRDPAQVADILSRWLTGKLQDQKDSQGATIEVFDVQAPASNGFSNETILCRTRTTTDGAVDERRLVVRVAPTKHLLFLDADFSTQYRVMRTLADAKAGVPLPTLGWYEEDPQFLGVPFFTMDHVEGDVPADNLPYTMEGWVIDAQPEQQERMWWSGIDAMAAVHRTDWRAAGLDWLGDPSRGRPGIQQQMSYYREFLDWAAQGTVVPTLEATWTWLVEHEPGEEGDVVLSWGDSRIGNIIWDDFNCAAVLDWEMASLGQPEMDLGWWLYFDRQFSDGLNVPRPSGFGSHEDTIARYSDLMGRPMKDIFFYEIFSGFRFGVVMLRLAELLTDSDILPQESDMGTNNLATQLLATMLEFPAPS